VAGRLCAGGVLGAWWCWRMGKKKDHVERNSERYTRSEFYIHQDNFIAWLSGLSNVYYFKHFSSFVYYIKHWQKN
jgi:hypothetical protein